MVRREKRDYTKSKKFFEVQKDRQSKLYERSVQKKTSYERDIRTMMHAVLEPLRAAEEGNGEITREELNKIRLRVEKIIIRIRVLSGNKGANLSQILHKVQNEKSIILDYLHGKRTLPGLVSAKGEASTHKISQEALKPSDNGKRKPEHHFEFDEYKKVDFDEHEEPQHTSKEAFFKSLGFDEEQEQEEEEIFVDAKPVPKTISASKAPSTFQPTEAFRRMSLNVIDDKMSQVISEGIEHLMLLRKKRGRTNINYRDEIIKFVDDEIIYKKNKTIEELKNKGYAEQQLLYFSELYDKEFEININLIIRKCLYLSRVLEYRKGSTSTG